MIIKNKYLEMNQSVTEINEESKLLFNLFRCLDEEKVKYCVLRNYETLPYSLGGSDLDLLVHPDDERRMINVIFSVVAKFNGFCISNYKVEASIYCFCGYFDGKWWGIHIDIFPILAHRGVTYYDISEVLDKKEDWRGIKVASEGHAYMTAFLKEYLAHGKNKKQYLQKAGLNYNKNKMYYGEIICKYFYNRSVRIITSCLENPENCVNSMALYKRVRRDLYLKAILKHKSCIILKILNGWRHRLIRLFKPPGASIAILGTDGSGKSTIICAIKTCLYKATHHEVFCEHMRPNLLPSIASLFGRPVKPGPTTNPHGSKPSGFCGSLLRLSYYSLDYVFGWWLKVFPAMVKRPTLFIFDRYFYDYIIDPRRGRINLPKWMIKLYGCFIPEPKLILCLGADPEIIHKRKPELPLEEVQRQVAELKKFCAKHKRAVWIDTGCEIEESVNQALEAITSQMAARYEKN